MEFHILGVLDVTHDGRAVPLRGGRQRALLALLLIERNTPVTGERIVEELWNGRAPATAAKVVQNLVVQLRRSLGDEDLLLTRGHAYELAVPDEAIDAVRFERLAEDGRRALAEDDAERAAALLREALALWRGPALGELAGEPWARAEAGRLEERRIVAFERRVDADLALGRHADVVSELEAAIARDPLREGMRARLMLALYRSGRQAEALEAFGEARRALVEDLGIEPGPELRRLHEAILNQDPVLEPPPSGRRQARRPPARRRRAGALLVAGGMALAAVAVGGAILLIGEESVAPAAAGGEAVAVSMRTGLVERRIPAGRAPSVVAAGGGRLWMVDGDARTLIGVDPDSGTVDTLATGGTPLDVALGGEDAVWVANGSRRERAAAVGPVTSEVVRLDGATRRQEAAVELPEGGADVTQVWAAQLAVSRDAVWTITGDGSVTRIDPRAAAIDRTVTRFRAWTVAIGDAGLWAAGANGRLVEFDPRTARIRRRVTLPTEEITTLAVGDAVWVTSGIDRKLWRIGPDEDTVPVSTTTGAGVADVAVTPQGVWLADPVAGTVTQVDPATLDVVRTVSVGGIPRSLAADGDTLWVAVTGTGGAATSEVAGVASLPGSICEPVVAGPGGKAHVLVVSDLPLQGDSRLTATQMAQAIAFTLREHGFRAGRHRIAYQSCDDALAATGFYDDGKCASNGRAYGRDADVVGVIGTFNSGCALTLIPALNRARGGPVGMVSPVNSFVGLTRDRPEANVPIELSSVYPTGDRNFVRVYPADDLQSAALAQFARDRGRRRVYVLDDGEPGYSVTLGDAFERAADKLGLDVVGRERWRSKARSYAGLAERVADSGAQAVFVAGLPQNNGGAVVRALRERLGDGVDVMASDGFAPPARILEAAGAAARGVFLGVNTQVLEELPPEGRAFIERFARTQPGVPVEVYAAYAAQATEVMLDAIARSDGTRASVLERLFDARLDDSLVGDIAFDDRGDVIRGAVTVLRVVGGRASANIASAEGAVVERVLHPSTTLVDRR